MQRRLLLDVVVAQRPAVFQLLARKDQPLLVRRDALLVLDLGLDVLDRVACLDLQRDRLARQCLDENLHVLLGQRVSGRCLGRQGKIADTSRNVKTSTTKRNTRNTPHRHMAAQCVMASVVWARGRGNDTANSQIWRWHTNGAPRVQRARAQQDASAYVNTNTNNNND